MKPITIGIQIFLAGCISLILAWMFLFPADSRYGFKYVMWKQGFNSFFDAKVVYSLLNVDPDLRASLIGADRNKIKAIFPDVKEDKYVNQYQAYYAKYLKDQDLFWLGESAWVVIFKDNRVAEFKLLKG